MIRAIKFVSIPVEDQDRALAFYTEKLGFEVRTDQHFSETMRWIELGLPGAETRVVLFGKKNVGEFSNITFVSNNVQSTYEELRQRGVEFPNPPKTEKWGTSVQFKDSEGNMFLLSSK